MELNVPFFFPSLEKYPCSGWSGDHGDVGGGGGGLNVKRERRLILGVIAVLVSSPAGAPSLRPSLHYL